MSRWFRFYDGALDDPKVQSLPGDLFKTWVNLLCVASKNDGKIPVADLAFMLRTEDRKIASAIKELTSRGLLDDTDGGPEPHNWSGRQHKSDVSNDRVKRHRERARNAEGNVTSAVTETPPDTETETEQIHSSEPNGSGADAPTGEIVPIDARTALFREGLSALRAMTGKPEGPARTLVGKWLKRCGDDAAVVLAVIRRAAALSPADPVAWIEKAFRPVDDDEAIYRGAQVMA